MALFKKERQIHAEIAIAPTERLFSFNSKSDHFLSHESIRGAATFVLRPNMKLDYSKITLKGTLLPTISTIALTVYRLD